MMGNRSKGYLERPGVFQNWLLSRGPRSCRCVIRADRKSGSGVVSLIEKSTAEHNAEVTVDKRSARSEKRPAVAGPLLACLVWTVGQSTTSR